MPTGIEEGLALINFAFVVHEVSSTAGSPASSSMLMEDLLKKAKNREIVEFPKRDTEKDLPAYRTPVADALLSIYKAPLPRRSYVFHAPASTGKSAAARFFMKTILPALPDAPHGLMIGGLAPNDNYVSYMASLLGATDSKGWAQALIQALVPDPKDSQRRKSILILDEFNSPGPDDINLSFARTLYKAFADSNVYLVFLSQSEQFADRLSDLNNRSKITALPTAVMNPDAEIPTKFQWKRMEWSRDLLTKYLEHLDDGKNPAIFENKDEHGAVDWIDVPMTPHKARWKYETRSDALLDEATLKKLNKLFK
jgi:hypothetical protein